MSEDKEGEKLLPREEKHLLGIVCGETEIFLFLGICVKPNYCRHPGRGEYRHKTDK